jgi:hypothetical protein
VGVAHHIAARHLLPGGLPELEAFGCLILSIKRRRRKEAQRCSANLQARCAACVSSRERTNVNPRHSRGPQVSSGLAGLGRDPRHGAAHPCSRFFDAYTAASR